MFKQFIPKALRQKSSLAIIITAVVLVETTSIVQYFFTLNAIRDEVDHRAKSELRAKSMEMHNIITEVESAINNSVWIVERYLDQPDSTYTITSQLVKQNPDIVGATVSFIADYYPQYGRWCELYSFMKADGTIEQRQIGGPTHDYLNKDWFLEGMAAEKGYWSEPYYDEEGAKMMLCSYLVPIRDAKGKVVGLLDADVSLDWLSEVTNSRRIYPSSFNLLISRKGQIMACRRDSLVLRVNVDEWTASAPDTTMAYVSHQMMAGRSGQATVEDKNGEINYVFYAQMDDGTGWSMAVVCPDREIYGSLRQLFFYLFLMMIAGMVLMGYIIWRSARNAMRLQAVNSEKERMSSELRIASDIQKGMLPKIFPPYPDRDDVEIYGSLVPAKEVGGDLYDFFIRDEKLFFCIGDVSGKGVPASLVMAVTRSLFRSVSAREANPDRIVAQVNDSMAEMNESNMFVTLFMGVLDLPTGRLRYCNAGHCSPILVGDSVELIPIIPNLPVGIMEGWKFEAQEILVSPHDTIFLYTDGLTEAENTIPELFGEKRMMDEAHQWISREPQVVIDRMTAAVHAFVGDAEQSDDLTMLAIQYTKEQLDVKLSRSLSLQNDVQQVPQLSQFVDEVCEDIGFDMQTTMKLNLAIEEAVVNVMNYAYPRGTVGDIHIDAQANDLRLKFVITDSGSPFDPTAMPEVDTTLSAEDRPIGGLGIHLVRQIMDSINYERIGGRNVLTLRKKLK